MSTPTLLPSRGGALSVVQVQDTRGEQRRRVLMASVVACAESVSGMRGATLRLNFGPDILRGFDVHLFPAVAHAP